ncbi:hypothetical protein Ctha_0512 [Chloroherpeton thalassium ATCC 35110]|uniref:Uncharacterized protein n=1 Tax=Chloroherpeton thalassium (strain ATCC 35110 / GB-78) TaxID=517418 RepID=B3QV29_CHLT3|nr:hypothetical protein [Chloroherpeton thalassium]ACF12983.1 hypothetical protein Ctha_0512 [Chloroherpeton thalassium ATCC 35110]
MQQEMLSKGFIEKTFLDYYAKGHHQEFYLADNFNNLKSYFPVFEHEHPKKLKDVAVSLVQAGLVQGSISDYNHVITVCISGITRDGYIYLRSIS